MFAGGGSARNRNVTPTLAIRRRLVAARFRVFPLPCGSPRTARAGGGAGGRVDVGACVGAGGAHGLLRSTLLDPRLIV